MQLRLITSTAPTRRGGGPLLTAKELAAVIGLRDPQQVLDLRQTDVQFPEPLGRVNRSFVWSWPQVEAWTKARAGLVSGPIGPPLAAFRERFS